MALLKKLKEKLGIGGSGDEPARSDTEVTVEHEPDEESASTESDESVDEPVATETDAAASTESLVDEEDAAADPTEAAEPAEAAGPESEDVEIDEDADDVDGTAVDSIKGIGPAYADRLSNIGIESVADLADADPAEVAEGANVGEKRAATWIERAQEF